MDGGLGGTERLTADAGGIARAAEMLRAGRLVAFPTETVYGLGGRADSPEAVAAIYAAKGRPAFNPLIAHVPSREAAEALVALPEAGRRLAGAFWPGPLTLVAPLRTQAGLAEAATAGLATAAVRVPGSAVARALLEAVGAPVAAPSANRSGRLSPTTAEAVLEQLSGRIAAVLDGGPCPVGLESAIVGFDAAGRPVLLRPGGVPAERLAEVCGPLGSEAEGDRPSAPGRLASHYAPGMRLRLNAEAPRPGEGWLGFGPGPEAPVAETLSASGDLAEAAATLYEAMRRLDARMGGRGTAAVARIPETGLGAAIDDRLRRAAAPRPGDREADE
ncbi:MAG TPA: L-threonylcarbamoyladenylate synthase [Paracoccaceae bacterium]|nr:L-threonylcarbamoyladenylate synthase [Paracoccaceae bacterium]